jgi:hypothetical protein
MIVGGRLPAKVGRCGGLFSKGVEGIVCNGDTFTRLYTMFMWLTHLFAGVAQLVEHHLAKVDVEGSNPFSRSIFCQGCKNEASP